MSTPSSTSPSAPATARRLVIGGIPTTVYSSPSSSSSSSAPSPSGLAILFLLHGRLGSAAAPLISTFANTLLSHASSQASSSGAIPAKDLIVVTFDQRNHGEREHEKERNLAWVEGGKRRAKEREEKGVQEHEFDNENHPADMVATQTGTAADVSFLIDFLPSALFPEDERTVTDWYCAGISLGGHATWLALANDSRIALGVPIIGSPSSLTLLTHRAAHLPAPHGPVSVPSPYFPASLVSLLKRIDPAEREIGTWKGKKVLVLSGKDDTLVNFEDGGSREFVERLEREGGLEKLEVWVQPKTGHACTPEMQQRAAEFVWKFGLSASSPSGKL